MSSFVEKRKYQRIKCDIPIIRKDNCYTIGVVSDVGIGGCFVQTSRFLIMNTKIKTIFELPYTLAKIEAKAEIIRYEENPKGMAVVFYEMGKDDRRILKQYLRDFGQQ